MVDLSEATKIRFRNGEEINLYTYIIQDIIFEQAIISNVFNTLQTKFLLSMRNYINYNNKVIEMISSSQGAPFLLNFDERSMAGMMLEKYFNNPHIAL